MTATMQQNSRPMTVNIALGIFLISFGASVIPQLLRAHWNDLFIYIKFGSELIILFLPLWFIFRGKNWARWLLVVFALAGFCLSMRRLSQHEHSASWLVQYCLRNLVVVAALIALFLPSAN